MKIHHWNGAQSKLALFLVHRFVHFEILTGQDLGLQEADGSEQTTEETLQSLSFIKFVQPYYPEISTQKWNKEKYLKLFLISFDSRVSL